MVEAGMRRLALAVTVLAACGDDGSAPADGSSSSGAMTTGAAFDGLPGDEVFAMACGFCHGEEALGTPFGPELRHPQPDYARFVVRRGRPGVEFPDSAMAAFGEEILGDETLDGVIEHLRAFPQPTTGEALYLDYCANCHGADGTGGATGRTLVGYPGTLIAAQIRSGGSSPDFALRDQYMPAYTPADLADAEVDAIIAHVLTF